VLLEHQDRSNWDHEAIVDAANPAEQALLRRRIDWGDDAG
jgi:predicted RNA polymerase sigma factor